MMLVVMAFEVFYSFCVVFVTCELGERLISEYEEIEYVICQFDWYLLPAEVQKVLPTIVINAQKTVTIECFGSTNTNRESFQKVRPEMRKNHNDFLENNIHKSLKFVFTGGEHWLHILYDDSSVFLKSKSKICIRWMRLFAFAIAICTELSRSELSYCFCLLSVLL